MIYIVCMHVYTVRRPRDTDTLGWIGITPVFTLGNSGVCMCTFRGFGLLTNSSFFLADSCEVYTSQKHDNGIDVCVVVV